MCCCAQNGNGHTKHMNQKLLLSKHVPENWAKQALEAESRRDKLIRILMEKGNIPTTAWDETTINSLLQRLSGMDSNNFLGNVGVGEREGRVFSGIVSRRHMSLSHGIGRSGDVGANQPKAAGSSVIARLTQSMVLDLLRRVLQMRSIKDVLVLPCATGMSLTLVFLTLIAKQSKPKRYALWTRMDQKTCFKSVTSAGVLPLVVENARTGDAVHTDLTQLELLLKENLEDIAFVVSTTSCFAPRVPDDVEQIAKLCLQYNVPHVINNAYGLQCNKCVHSVEVACRMGRVDAVIQSTDKNFMVPVGGCIVSSPNAEFLQQVSQIYPGRASLSPVLDLFVTLLEMGQDGYENLRRSRITLASGEFRAMLIRVAERNGERLLISQRNTISFAITLTSTTSADASLFGSMLFTRGVSGARVVKRHGNIARLHENYTFTGYGSSCVDYPCDYVALACAIGTNALDLPVLEQRLNECFHDWKK